MNNSNISNYVPSSSALNNKVIIVTGAGDGIGKTAAIAYAATGATVVLLGRTLSKLEATYDEIEAHGFAQPAIFPINFESAVEADYQALVEAIEETFGKIDGLLHNAAMLGARTPLKQYADDVWQRVMQVNVNAPFMLTKALLPLCNKKASIVFTSSSVAHRGKAYWGAYSVSKAAVLNLMEVLADELDGTSEIRTNTINPGATRTAMRATAYPAEDPSTVKAPEEIMNAYVFLMSAESENINGQAFDL